RRHHDADDAFAEEEERDEEPDCDGLAGDAGRRSWRYPEHDQDGEQRGKPDEERGGLTEVVENEPPIEERRDRDRSNRGCQAHARPPPRRGFFELAGVSRLARDRPADSVR